MTDRRMIKAQQASGISMRHRKYANRPLFPVDTDKPFRKCQWIAGEPSPDDSVKCGARAVPGRPYCEEHTARAYRRGE